MATIALCPHCRQAITVPIDVIPDQRFLCPLCQAEFAVEEALALSNAVPPAQPSTSSSIESNAAGNLPVEYVSDMAELRSAPPRYSLRRRSGRLDWLNQLISIVGGGVIGLSMGYCILLRLRGQEADFLQIADRLPTWATGLPPLVDGRVSPAEQQEPNVEGDVADESDSGEEDVAE